MALWNREDARIGLARTVCAAPGRNAMEAGMLRSVTITLVLIVGLVLPAAAQQMSDQDARLAGEDILRAYNKGLLDHDATGLAALYTEDAVIFTTNGPVSGRPAIEKALADTFKHYRPDPSKLERVVAVGNDAIMRGGSWSGTFQGVGAPVHLRGFWTTTDVREGGTWKIRMETWNVAATVTGDYYFQPASSDAR
jgi:ketosteroid isomerase-like protein